MITDTVVYETTPRDVRYVIQFQDENGRWQDSHDPALRSFKSAKSLLDLQTWAPYPHRIVERRG